MAATTCNSAVGAHRSQSIVEQMSSDYNVVRSSQRSSVCNLRANTICRQSADDTTPTPHPHLPLTSNYLQPSLYAYPSAPILATPSTRSYTMYRAKMDPVYGQPTGHNMGRWQSWGANTTTNDSAAKEPTVADAQPNFHSYSQSSVDFFIEAGIPMSNGTLFASPCFPQQTCDQFSCFRSVVDVAPWAESVPISTSFSSGVYTDFDQQSSSAGSYDTSFTSVASTAVVPDSNASSFGKSGAMVSSPVVVTAGNSHPVHAAVASADRAAAYTIADIQSIVYQGHIPVGSVASNSVRPWVIPDIVVPIDNQYQTQYIPVGNTFVDDPVNLDPRNLQPSFPVGSLYTDIAQPRPKYAYNTLPTWAAMPTPASRSEEDVEEDEITRRRSELRKKHDKILLEERAKGMSYTDIIAKHKLPGENATWRGRYRYLTRPPHERKRKVSWTDGDTGLLRSAICASSPMLSHLNGNFTNIIRQQPCKVVDIEKLGIDWAQVVVELQNLGCSYKFSVIACKKEFRRILGFESKPRLHREAVRGDNARPWRVPGYGSTS